VNTVRKELVRASDIKPTTCTKLTMWNGTASKPHGEVELLTANPKTGQKSKVSFLVVDDNLSCLLGLETVQKFNLVEVKGENFISQVDGRQGTENNQDGLGTASLEIDPNVPLRILPCRKVPLALKSRVNEKLQELIKRGILVEETRPTEWVSQMTVVEKESGDVRICIDPQPLNRALMKEHCKLPTLEDVLPDLHDAKFFSKLDVEEAYWQVKLDEKSSKLTTMITPFGCLRWTRLPFGLKVSSEIFQQRLAAALNDLTGCKNIADAILVYGCGKDEKEAEAAHDHNLQQLQQRCEIHGIKLNEKKSEFKKKELKFHGHIVSTTGIRADPQKIKAIAEMPAPTDVQGIRRFCGMIQYLAKYIPNLSQTLDPLRALTKKHTASKWSSECQRAFEEAKKKVVKETLLAYYDPEKELTLQVDNSKEGIGMVLLQDGKQLEFASKSMTQSQQSAN